MVFNSLKNIVLEEKIYFAWDTRLLIIAFFISEEAFTFKVEGTGAVISGRGSEVIIIIVSINQNI